MMIFIDTDIIDEIKSVYSSAQARIMFICIKKEKI